MPTVTAPVADYNGTVCGVTFEDGHAETDDPAALAYFRRQGYGVAGGEVTGGQAPDTVDPRDYDGATLLGTALRDGAVDPRPEDFLPPTNAGQENPHGPLVVAPGIHGASGPIPPLPGLVSSDPAVQQEKETRAAQRILVDQEPVQQVAGVDLDLVPDADRLDHRTGDPVEADAEAATEQGDEPAMPAKSAPKAEWVAYAVAVDHKGLTEGDAEAMTKAELVELYGS